MIRKFLLASASAAAVLALAPTAMAQTTSDDIVRSLKPAAPATRSLTRGLGAPSAPATRAIEVIPGQEEEVLKKNPDLPRIDLTIEFEFDSDRPTPAGERQLAQLGDALRNPALQTYRFMLGGHTDARGSDYYNQELSERRARAVHRYLVDYYAIDPQRLRTVGFGERRLIDPGYPESPRNRRVEVINIY